MLFMVIEHFTPANLGPMGDRFKLNGRMLPDGVVYHASWMETDGSRCFQIMEAPDRAALDVWITRWADLVEFKVAEVRTSADYWAQPR